MVALDRRTWIRRAASFVTGPRPTSANPDVHGDDARPPPQRARAPAASDDRDPRREAGAVSVGGAASGPVIEARAPEASLGVAVGVAIPARARDTREPQNFAILHVGSSTSQ